MKSNELFNALGQHFESGKKGSSCYTVIFPCLSFIKSRNSWFFLSSSSSRGSWVFPEAIPFLLFPTVHLKGGVSRCSDFSEGELRFRGRESGSSSDQPVPFLSAGLLRAPAPTLEAAVTTSGFTLGPVCPLLAPAARLQPLRSGEYCSHRMNSLLQL